MSAAAPEMTTLAVSYGARPVKRRRRSKAELDAVDDAIMTVLREENPATLRGTFYRVVSLGAVEKSELGYRLVGRQVLKLRRSGTLPMSWITDGTRYIVKPTTWRDVNTMLRDAASSYRRQLWRDQHVSVQLFTEKDAITGVVESVTAEWDIPLGILRGFASESFCWEVAESLSPDAPVFLYQLGDHDPSGVAAWADFEKKVCAFNPGAHVTFQRLAVVPEQIAELSLPTRPTKQSDSRARQFEGESVEVDAIPPNKLRDIVREANEQHVDAHQLAVTRAAENSERRLLTNIVGGAS